MYAGGKDTEGVEDVPDSADTEEERGITLLRQVLTETVGEGFSRKGLEKGRM